MSAELKKKLNSLLTLQHHYVQLVEEEDPGHSETLNNYIDLIDNLKGQIKKSSIKFAKMILQNVDFFECLEAPNGKKISFRVTYCI